MEVKVKAEAEEGRLDRDRASTARARVTVEWLMNAMAKVVYLMSSM